MLHTANLGCAIRALLGFSSSQQKQPCGRHHDQRSRFGDNRRGNYLSGKIDRHWLVIGLKFNVRIDGYTEGFDVVGDVFDCLWDIAVHDLADELAGFLL